MTLSFLYGKYVTWQRTASYLFLYGKGFAPEYLYCIDKSFLVKDQTDSYTSQYGVQQS